MRFILILIIAVCFSGCGKFNSRYRQTPESRKRDYLADRVLAKTAAKIKKEKGLVPCGTGGRMRGKIKMLALSFDYYHHLDVDYGRELLITATEELISEINNDENIRPYLDVYPFDFKNVKIEIFLHQSNNVKIDPRGLSVLVASDGVLRYKIDDLETNGLKTIYQETYEEALERIETIGKFSEAL